MSTADIPPFVFAFKLFLLILASFTLGLVGKFVYHVLWPVIYEKEQQKEYYDLLVTETKEKKLAAKKGKKVKVVLFQLQDVKGKKVTVSCNLIELHHKKEEVVEEEGKPEVKPEINSSEVCSEGSNESGDSGSTALVSDDDVIVETPPALKDSVCIKITPLSQNLYPSLSSPVSPSSPSMFSELLTKVGTEGEANAKNQQEIFSVA